MNVVSESLLVVKSLGYQVEVQYAGFRTVRFIPWEHVKYIFINEVISKVSLVIAFWMQTKLAFVLAKSYIYIVHVYQRHCR